jgi:thiamine-monophosphate kinase
MGQDALGEFGLIARLTTGLESRPDVVLGVGDDAALLDPGAGAWLVATCDAQIEGRHFIHGVATPEEIGHKALAVNLSDIAAMGAEPLWALISLHLPASVEVEFLDRVYAGLRALASRHGVALVGGNVASTEGPLALDVTLLGRVRGGAAVPRSGARPGDALVVTGTLGAAAAGVLAFVTRAGEEPPAVGAAALRRAREAMVTPVPRIAAGQALGTSGVVGAMLDISDGLASDLGHICAASGVGALLEAEAIPVDAAATEVAHACALDPLALALHGGEDYELLCAVRPEGVQLALDAVARSGGAAAVIGRVTEAGDGMLMRTGDGTIRTVKPRGWDHLRRTIETCPIK